MKNVVDKFGNEMDEYELRYSPVYFCIKPRAMLAVRVNRLIAELELPYLSRNNIAEKVINLSKNKTTPPGCEGYWQESYCNPQDETEICKIIDSFLGCYNTSYRNNAELYHYYKVSDYDAIHYKEIIIHDIYGILDYPSKIIDGVTIKYKPIRWYWTHPTNKICNLTRHDKKCFVCSKPFYTFYSNRSEHMKELHVQANTIKKVKSVCLSNKCQQLLKDVTAPSIGYVRYNVFKAISMKTALKEMYLMQTEILMKQYKKNIET